MNQQDKVVTAKKKTPKARPPSAYRGEEVPTAKRRGLVPSNGENRVMTPPALAQQLVDHFVPQMNSTVLDPARGAGAFTNALKLRLPTPSLFWAEVDEGINFFDAAVSFSCVAKTKAALPPRLIKFGFIITNPPWEGLLHWWLRGMELADNVVYLCLVPNVFQKAKRKAIKAAGFGIKEIVYVKTPPPKTPWPQAGFCLGAVHIQRDYQGDIKETFLPDYDT
jgi:hypothetical protein